MKKRDFWILSALVIFSFIYWFGYKAIYSNRPAKAEIYINSQLAETIDLSKGEEKRFSVNGKEHVIFHVYEDGSICFEESDCPDKVCVHSGRLRIVGQSAACLPNELILKIVPQEQHQKDDLDIVIGN